MFFSSEQRVKVETGEIRPRKRDLLIVYRKSTTKGLGLDESNLEVEFPSQLDDASCDTLHAGPNRTESSGADIAVERARIGVEVIGDVEDLSAEFKAHRLRYTEAFVHREIYIDNTRQTDRIRARRSTKTAISGRILVGTYKSGGVEPLQLGALIAGEIFVGR